MTEHTDFIETVVQLMRLTREGKIDWQREGSPSEREEALYGAAPTYVGELQDMTFTLKAEGARAEGSQITYPSSPNYQLIIEDQSTSERIESPFLKAVTDLAAVVRTRANGEENLEVINKRLKAL